MFQVKRNGHPGYLPAGTYSVRIQRANEQMAKTGNRQLALELEAVEGEHQGKIARAWLTEAPGTELIWKYFTAAAFPEATGYSVEFEPEDLIDREVVIKVEHPDDAEYPKVARYYRVAHDDQEPDQQLSKGEGPQRPGAGRLG